MGMIALERRIWQSWIIELLMGKVKNDWQDRDYVLKWFGTKEGEAKRNYRQMSRF
jgi:hypothetical protein